MELVVRSGGIAYVSKLYVRVRHCVPPCCRWLQNTAPEQRPQRTAAAFRSWLHYRYGDYGMVIIYSTSLYIIYIAHHYNITQDAEREMHEVQYLYVAFP